MAVSVKGYFRTGWANPSECFFVGQLSLRFLGSVSFIGYRLEPDKGKSQSESRYTRPISTW